MPIYMDLHVMPDGVTAEHVAEMHQADLKIEHEYNCRGLTYWCDEKRKTAFCLIEAPSIEALSELHKQAHGDIPKQIIEVNDTIVESFLGRIEDPEKSKNVKLNIINDPAFRTIMVIKFKRTVLRESVINKLNAAMKNSGKSVINITGNHDGRIVKQEVNSFLISFASVTNAVECALKIQELQNHVITVGLEIKIGISAGIPVTDKEGIFEDTIKAANYLCEIKDNIAISPEVKDLYESENLNVPLNKNNIHALSLSDEIFLMDLFDYIHEQWHNVSLNVDDFSNDLGYSKSQLYRKITSVTGKSVNSFVKDFRLDKALKLLDKKSKNISEIAFETGFNSSAYFSKCFQEKYGILPSIYIKYV